MAAAKRRAIDGFRRDKMLARKHAEIGRDLEDERDTSVEDIEAAMDDDVGDELLEPDLHRLPPGAVAPRRARP